MSLYWLFLACAISYFIGNINFSVILSKFILRKDVRKCGSGNPGATNMLRNFGFKWGLVILILDMLKGAIAALAGYLIWGAGTENGTIALYACGLAVVLGHCFPVFSKFKGGKGVSTTVGVFFVVNPALAGIMLSFGMIYGIIFEYASLSSIMFITAALLWEGFYGGASITVSALLIAFYLLVLFTHRKNIFKLFTGAENRASPLARIKRKKLKKKQQVWLTQV